MIKDQEGTGGGTLGTTACRIDRLSMEGRPSDTNISKNSCGRQTGAARQVGRSVGGQQCYKMLRQSFGRAHKNTVLKFLFPQKLGHLFSS
jgi:hypothetical protein